MSSEKAAAQRQKERYVLEGPGSRGRVMIKLNLLKAQDKKCLPSQLSATKRADYERRRQYRWITRKQ